MHPEIRKFWEDAGHRVEIRQVVTDPPAIIWDAIKDNYRCPIAIDHSGVVTYYMCGKSPRTEHEMLRVIKLKAFL